MGAFQGALQVLQSIVMEMQGQGGIGSIAGKQLSVMLDQVWEIPIYVIGSIFQKNLFHNRSRDALAVQRTQITAFGASRESNTPLTVKRSQNQH